MPPGHGAQTRTLEGRTHVCGVSRRSCPLGPGVPAGGWASARHSGAPRAAWEAVWQAPPAQGPVPPSGPGRCGGGRCRHTSSGPSGSQSAYERQGIAVMTPTVPGSPKGPLLGLPRGTMRRQKSIGKQHGRTAEPPRPPAPPPTGPASVRHPVLPAGHESTVAVVTPPGDMPHSRREAEGPGGHTLQGESTDPRLRVAAPGWRLPIKLSSLCVVSDSLLPAPARVTLAPTDCCRQGLRPSDSPSVGQPSTVPAP